MAMNDKTREPRAEVSTKRGTVTPATAKSTGGASSADHTSTARASTGAAVASAVPTAAKPRPSLDRFGPHAAAGLFAALVLVFAGERIFAHSDALRSALTSLGVAVLAASIALRLGIAKRAEGERRSVELSLAKFALLPALGLAVYFATSETGRKLFGIASMQLEPRTKLLGGLTVAWIGLVVLGLLPLVFGEVSLAPMRAAARVELRRVVAATRAGLALALAVLYVTLTTYGVSELDIKADFSYFRTARPGESTRSIVGSLTEPLKVQAFFPPLNEVGLEVHGYLDDLARASNQVEVEKLDRLAVPAIAKEAKVSSDGVVVLSKGGMRETIFFGTEMKSAASKLKTLDADFQKSLLKVLRTARTVHLTVGHGELNEPQGSAESEGRTMRTFKKLLENQNYTVKDLGLAQGLAKDVPDTAFLVAILGPTREFLPEEIAALERFVARGGKVLMALDPEAKVDFGPLAKAVDLEWRPNLLANDKMHMSRRQPRPSDTTILLTNRFSSHASVSTLSRNSTRMAIIVPGAASIEKAAGTSAKIDFIVRAMSETFVDENGNFSFDEGEKRSSYNIAAAVTKPSSGAKGKDEKANDKAKDDDEARALVIADADVLSDAAMVYEANFLFAVDALRWLGGEESFSGSITSTEDVRIEHTKEKDQIWFYGIIFGAPALVLGAGLWVSRQARRGDAAPPKERSKPAPSPKSEKPAAAPDTTASDLNQNDDDEDEDDDQDDGDDAPRSSPAKGGRRNS